MGFTTELTTNDGAAVSAYRAEPTGTPRGGIVVLQEIFGINAHIRRVTESFAELGYVAIAPALFDRQVRGVELGYYGEDNKRAFELWEGSVQADALEDVDAAIRAVSGAGKVGVVGFCWGGGLAYAAAATLPGLSATVSYYGNIPALLHLKPRVPIMAHFAERDDHVDIERIDDVRQAAPDGAIFTYEADHGFNTLPRTDRYDKATADLAWARTLAFLEEQIG